MDSKKKEPKPTPVIDSFFSKAKTISGLLNHAEDEINSALNQFGQVKTKVASSKTENKEKK